MLVGYFQIQGHGEQAVRQEKEAETRVRDTIRYIKQNFHLPLSVSSLSQQAKLNLDKYEKTFKALEGIPPRKYIEALRIAEAKKLLSATQLSVSDIAYTVGFANANYFSNVFKKLCHVSPTEYRNGIAR
jgi:AraC-like DNA-binding protein